MDEFLAWEHLQRQTMDDIEDVIVKEDIPASCRGRTTRYQSSYYIVTGVLTSMATSIGLLLWLG